MVAEIYYFTGTGNSLVAARDIAGRLDGKIIPVALTEKDPMGHYSSAFAKENEAKRTSLCFLCAS